MENFIFCAVKISMKLMKHSLIWARYVTFAVKEITSQIFLNERRAFQFYHVITKLRIDEIAFSDVIAVPGIPSYLEPMMPFDCLEQTPISLGIIAKFHFSYQINSLKFT